MAHELDITDGQVSFANSRSDAWHRLGQSVGHTMTAREALQAAHLAGWNVRKMPLQVPQQPVIGADGVTTPAPLAVPDFYATVRTNPINGALDVLGVVGSKYEPVQNEAFPIEIACRPRSLETIAARSTPAFLHTFQHAMSKFAGLFGHRRSEGNRHGGEPPPPHDATEGVSFCEPPMRTGFEDTVSASPRDQGRSAAQCEE
jgi:hypothetical protein